MMLVEMLICFSVFPFKRSNHWPDSITSPPFGSLRSLEKVWDASKNSPIEKFLKINSILIGRPSVGSYGLLSLLFASSVYMCSYILYMLV